MLLFRIMVVLLVLVIVALALMFALPFVLFGLIAAAPVIAWACWKIRRAHIAAGGDDRLLAKCLDDEFKGWKISVKRKRP